MNIITFKTIKTFKPTHVEWSFSSSHSCFWHFGTRETSLSTLGGVTLLTSNGGALIHGPDFSSIFGQDKIPLIFSFLYKGSWTPFPSFFIAVHNFQSIQTSKLITHQIVHHIFKKRLQRSSRTTKISLRSCLRKFYFHNFLYLLG